jgi:hypothetical protein
VDKGERWREDEWNREKVTRRLESLFDFDWSAALMVVAARSHGTFPSIALPRAKRKQTTEDNDAENLRYSKI